MHKLAHMGGGRGQSQHKHDISWEGVDGRQLDAIITDLCQWRADGLKKVFHGP